LLSAFSNAPRRGRYIMKYDLLSLIIVINLN